MPLAALALALMSRGQLAVAAGPVCPGSAGCPTVTAPSPESLLVKNLGDEERKRPGPQSSHVVPVGKPVTYILDPTLRVDPATGQPCVFIGEVPGEPGSITETNNEAHAFELLGVYPLCQGSPRPPAQPTPGGAAALAFEQLVTLPQPTMSIPPGYTVAGLRTYLVIGGPQRLDPEPIDALGYSVTLHITSTYDIDWGEDGPDRNATHVTSQGGRGYPDGDVFHVYTSKGTYPVTVTQRWTATYDIAGGGSGTIADVLSTSATSALPVRAYQAVVTS